jgi:NADPH-dependent FMN reductase
VALTTEIQPGVALADRFHRRQWGRRERFGGRRAVVRPGPVYPDQREGKALGVVKALVLNCTLKRSPEASNTEALARVVAHALRREQVECEVVRVVDLNIPPGVSSHEGDGDEWPALREKILASEIFVLASPTWLGQPSSVAKRVLERMDAMLFGFTVPGQAWTYWNRGPGPGDDYLDTEEGHDWSRSTGEAAAFNLIDVARALQAHPISPPPSG